MSNELETVTIYNVPDSINPKETLSYRYSGSTKHSKGRSTTHINAGHGTVEMQSMEIGWRGRAHDVPSIRAVEIYQVGIKALSQGNV